MYRPIVFEVMRDTGAVWMRDCEDCICQWRRSRHASIWLKCVFRTMFNRATRDDLGEWSRLEENYADVEAVTPRACAIGSPMLSSPRDRKPATGARAVRACGCASMWTFVRVCAYIRNRHQICQRIRHQIRR